MSVGTRTLEDGRSRVAHVLWPTVCVEADKNKYWWTADRGRCHYGVYYRQTKTTWG